MKANPCKKPWHLPPGATPHGSVNALTLTLSALESSPAILDLATSHLKPPAPPRERRSPGPGESTEPEYQLEVGRAGDFKYVTERPEDQTRTRKSISEIEGAVLERKANATRETMQDDHVALKDIARDNDTGEKEDEDDEDLVLVFDMSIEDIFGREEEYVDEVAAHIQQALGGGDTQGGGGGVVIVPGWVKVLKLEMGSIRVFIKFGEGPSCGGKGGGISSREAIARLHDQVLLGCVCVYVQSCVVVG